jgi:alkylhydroperoxidase/carboxymuconolactone decarboxylase family protein YurZ
MSEAHISSEHPAALDCKAMFRKHDPAWCDAVLRMEQETSRGVLEPKLTEFVQLVIHASITALNTNRIRHHIRSALREGASAEEILAVLKLCSVIGIHAMAVASPILDESLRRAGMSIDPTIVEMPMISALRARERFNPAWDLIEKWDPAWLECFLAVGLDPDIERVLGESNLELLYIAIDATVTHLYCPGTRRHIEAALRIGVHPLEILEVLKLVSIQGIRSVEAGIGILDEESQAAKVD